MKLLRETFKQFFNNPGKTLITVLSVGLGIGILTLTLSISLYLSESLAKKLNSQGTIINYINAEKNPDGTFDFNQDSQVDKNIAGNLQKDVPGLIAAAPVMGTSFTRLAFEEREYSIRNSQATTDQYLKVFGLEIINGRNLDLDDLERGSQITVISRETAEIIFGSPENAIGKELKAPIPEEELNMIKQFGEDEYLRYIYPTYRVIGVYENPESFLQKAYGIADIIVPLTSMIPSGEGFGMYQDNLYRQLVLRFGDDFASGNNKKQISEPQAKALVLSSLSYIYGSDVVSHMWKGTSNMESFFLDDLNETINLFSVVISLLGFILLFSSSIGILSIMLIDVLGNTRKISLERALGASRGYIIQHYIVKSFVLVLISAAAGILFSILFSNSLYELIRTIIPSASDLLGRTGIVSIKAAAAAAGGALVIGVLFGSLPVLFALKTEISEGVREI